MEIIGWREWVGLPMLGVERIKAKVDSGARTSAIHAEDIRVIKKGKKYFVRFTIYPSTKSRRKKVRARVELVDHRHVKSSHGSVTLRPVIATILRLGDSEIPIELNLVNRDVMGYRMLIGRTGLDNRFLIHPGKSFLLGKKKGPVS